MYHVTQRGVALAPIFCDDLDRHAFLRFRSDAERRFGWTTYVYCLMTDHYHLVIEAEQEALSRGMHRLNFLHAQRFNRRYDRVGHLFQNRFGAKLIVDDVQLVNTIAYVRDNPVRAGLCERAADWPWTDCAFRRL